MTVVGTPELNWHRPLGFDFSAFAVVVVSIESGIYLQLDTMFDQTPTEISTNISIHVLPTLFSMFRTDKTPHLVSDVLQDT